MDDEVEIIDYYDAPQQETEIWIGNVLVRVIHTTSGDDADFVI